MNALFWIKMLCCLFSFQIFAKNTPPQVDVPQKKALIFGVSGQDGSYLSEFLLEKGYEVHGVQRRSSIEPEPRYAYEKDPHFISHYGDLSDPSNVFFLIHKIQPDEIYNLAALSQVQISFEVPEYTAKINALGTLHILEAIKQLHLEKKTRFYQASTSELYAGSKEPKKGESASIHPCSPYGISKLFAYWTTINYREAFGLFACNGILFNHESPRRGDGFVTSKIIQAALRISQGKQEICSLGNLNARRDWGYAKDYVEAMWLILQEDTPNDFVIATGETHSVREFVELAFKEVGIDIEWQGNGLDEIGIDKKTKKTVINIDPSYFRPLDPISIESYTELTKNRLDWHPKTSFKDLVKIMITVDIDSNLRQ